MPDLPSGTVTFLFTDIEGSTAPWERDRGAWRTVLTHHQEALELHQTYGAVSQTADALSGIALVGQTLGQHPMTVGLLAAAHLRQHIGQPITRWIKAEVEPAIAAERVTSAPETFTAAWEAGSHVDHLTAIARRWPRVRTWSSPSPPEHHFPGTQYSLSRAIW